MQNKQKFVSKVLELNASIITNESNLIVLSVGYMHPYICLNSARRNEEGELYQWNNL